MFEIRTSKITRLILILTVILLISISSYAQFSGGTGEPNNPYQIATAEDLIALSEKVPDYNWVFKNFILTADIDMNPNLPGRKVFQQAIIFPIDDSDPIQIPFLGVFDGDGHTISNLTISGGSYVGLFGFLETPAKVIDLGLVNVNITGNQFVGGLVGINGQYTWKVDGGSIVGCYVTGSVKGNSDYIGGLVGMNLGPVGLCYSIGLVEGHLSIGGLVGKSVGSGSVTQCYSACLVKSFNGFGSGGLIGSKASESTISESFWDIVVSGVLDGTGDLGPDPNGVTGKTTYEMQDPNTFIAEGWDFVYLQDGPDDIWAEPAGGGYPILWWQQSPLPEFSFSGGTGEPNNPYLISNAEELNSIGSNPRLMKCHFKLIKDVNLADVNFYPIGSSEFPFEGIFDGNNHKISNMKIEGVSDLGLFSKLGGGNITKVGVVDVNIIGTGNCVGGLVGNVYFGTISQCYSTGSVKGFSDYVGGLVGKNFSPYYYSPAVIKQCYSTALVKGNQSVGGLVGQNYDNGKVVECYSTGLVKGNDFVGGLVGNNWGTVTDCYSTGTVVCNVQKSNVGGLVGKWSYTVPRGGTPPTIPPVFNSFWDINTSGQTKSAGGLGKYTPKMQTRNTFTDEGKWDFIGETENGPNDVWWILEGKDYPRLWWQLPEDDFNDCNAAPLWFPYEIAPEQAHLEEVNGRLEVNTSGSLEDVDAIYIPYNWGLDANKPFEIQVNFHFSKTGTGDGRVNLGIVPSMDPTAMKWAEFEAGTFDDNPFYLYEIRDGEWVEEQTSARYFNDGTLYISYDPNSDELYFSSIGYGKKYAFWTVPDLIRGRWQTDSIYIILSGGSEGGLSLTGEDAWLDNFKVAKGKIWQ
jgi:hypothetical protein